jgi:surface antigen
MNVRIALLATAALALSPVFAAPANAETTGTVKAPTTQRMSGPNLTSGQDGVYRAGENLTLVCHTSGEPVKGYFSFNIPNGGWDSLWYKTSDGHYVADVDIETHTLNALGPDCGPAAPPPAPASNAAANRTQGATIDHNPLSGYEGYCTWGAQERVHTNAGYYIKALTGTAVSWANQGRAAGWTVVDEPQPRAIVVFDAAVAGNPDGHVAWVDAVNGKDVTITEMNYGRGATAENGYRTAGFNKFDTRTVKHVPGMSYILIP